MKAPSSVKTPKQYLDHLPQERQKALRVIHRAIQEAAPELKPHVAHGMIGYGPFHYRYASGREGDWFVVGLASQKNHMSLYLCACDKDGYLAEKNKHRLGKVSVGRSCVRFRRLEDLNLAAAMKLVRQAAKIVRRPGGFGL